MLIASEKQSSFEITEDQQKETSEEQQEETSTEEQQEGTSTEAQQETSTDNVIKTFLETQRRLLEQQWKFDSWTPATPKSQETVHPLKSYVKIFLSEDCYPSWTSQTTSTSGTQPTPIRPQNYLNSHPWRRNQDIPRGRWVSGSGGGARYMVGETQDSQRA